MKDKHVQSWMIGIFSTVLVVGAVASFAGQKQTFFKGTDLLGAAQNDMRAAQTSLLMADSLSKSDQEYFSIIDEENKRRIEVLDRSASEELQKQNNAASPSKEAPIRIKAKTASSTTGCAAGTTPVVRDGVLTECRGDEGRENGDLRRDEERIEEREKNKTAPEVKIIYVYQQQSAPTPTLPAPVVVAPSSPAPSAVAVSSEPRSEEESSQQSCESQGKWSYTGPDRPGLLYGMCIDCSTHDYILTNGSCQK